MADIEIKVNRTLDDEFVSNVLVTAFDGAYGGCWYWADLYVPNQEPAFRTEDDGDIWLAVRITLDYDKTDGGTGYAHLDHVMKDGIWVDNETVRVGIQRLLDGDTVAGDYIREAIMRGVLEGDTTNIDADGADCIIQAGLFGRLVFG